MKLSILIINYHTRDLLEKCQDSIKRQVADFEYEVIVKDNTNDNIGFGPANNLIANKAQGEYLLLLNPDTELLGDRDLSDLVKYLDTHPMAAIVAPRLIDREGRYQWSANKEVTLARFIIDKPLAILYRYWGERRLISVILSKLSPRYRFNKLLTDVDRVSAAAIMIRKDIFYKVGGFDENLFLYFEDDDLCKKVRDLEYEIHYLPQVTIKHGVGESLPENANQREKYYYQSQDYYFKKHRSFLEYYILRVMRLPYRLIKLRQFINRYY